MRRDDEKVKALGGEIICIGTGDARYARAFIEDEEISWTVLLDDDGEAADAASVRKGNAAQILGPKAIRSALKAYSKGHRQKAKLGKRPTQLGATFVIGPGEVSRYSHLDDHVGDHAPLEEILAALK